MFLCLESVSGRYYCAKDMRIWDFWEKYFLIFSGFWHILRKIITLHLKNKILAGTKSHGHPRTQDLTGLNSTPG